MYIGCEFSSGVKEGRIWICHWFQVYYNNINILKRAKERTAHVSSIGIAWTCSAEFDADEKNAISFVENDAYVVLAKPPVQTGER